MFGKVLVGTLSLIGFGVILSNPGTPLTVAERLGLGFVYLFGLHYVYSYVSRKNMYIPGFTIGPNDPIRWRLSLCIVGLLIMTEMIALSLQ